MEIKFSGLRPGEKLYEELSITNHLEPTTISKIFVSKEKGPEAAELDQVVNTIMKCIDANDTEGIRDCFTNSFVGMKKRF